MASRYDKAFKIKYKQASAELKSQIDAARGKDVTPKEVTRYIKEVIALAESEEKFV